MFWDASYTPSPKIEALLNKETVTLLELLEDEEIISECKSQNSKLVQFLNRPDILEELVSLITTVPAGEVGDTLRFKHSNIACEILTSDLQAINRSIVCEEKVLLKLYAFLEQDAALNPLLLSFFSKVFGMLWTQKQKQDWFTYQFVCVTLLEFLKSRGNFLDTVLRHVYSPVMLDLVYHMVTHIEGPDIRKTLYEWLMEQNLVEKLIGILGETGEESAEKHLNVAQFVVEYLAMGRTKRQSEKQEGVTSDPILDLLEDRTTIQLLLDKMVAGEAAEVSSSAIVAGTRIILALFDDNLINDNTDDPALQYLVNSEKEHHQTVTSNLIEVIKGYVDKFHDLLLVEPAALDVDSGISNETVVVTTTAESTPEKNADDSKDSGKASDSEKADDEPKLSSEAIEDEEEEEVEIEVKQEAAQVEKNEAVAVSPEDSNNSSATSSPSSTEALSPERDSPEKSAGGDEEAAECAEDKNGEVIAEDKKGAPGASTQRNNNFSRGPAFGNTRLQICCLFTVLLETENRDIINAICASSFFKTLLNLFKQYCWNNFLHSQAKKCLSYAISAYDEKRDDASGTVQLEISELQRHLIVDCRLAPLLVECWYTNEVEEVERNGVRLGYMGHLIAILDVLVTNCKVSEKLRALVEDTLSNDEVPPNCSWPTLTAEKGQLEKELDNQNRYLADCNPARMNDCEPKDFFIEATDTFQDLESSALSENLDNFLSRYISSDLNSHFFTTVNGWSEDNLDEFEGLADKNWSKFDGDGDDDDAEASGSDPVNFARPWDDEEETQDGSPEDDLKDELAAGGGEAVVLGSQPVQDSGWANFSSANFADFDTHFNEFAIGTFDGTESQKLAASGSGQLNNTFDLGAEGDLKKAEEEEAVDKSAGDTKKVDPLASEGPAQETPRKDGAEEAKETNFVPAKDVPESSDAAVAVESLTGKLASFHVGSSEEGDSPTESPAEVNLEGGGVVDGSGEGSSEATASVEEQLS